SLTYFKILFLRRPLLEQTPMSHPPFQQALTEAELDRLTGFL
ncbi:hypothetical protein Pgy4_39535, partial [Pseudomonas savastanoi pv. glycinea str. race 4]